MDEKQLLNSPAHTQNDTRRQKLPEFTDQPRLNPLSPFIKSNSASPSNEIIATPGESPTVYSNYQSSEYSENGDPFFGVDFDAVVHRNNGIPSASHGPFPNYAYPLSPIVTSPHETPPSTPLEIEMKKGKAGTSSFQNESTNKTGPLLGHPLTSTSSNDRSELEDHFKSSNEQDYVLEREQNSTSSQIKRLSDGNWDDSLKHSPSRTSKNNSPRLETGRKYEEPIKEEPLRELFAQSGAQRHVSNEDSINSAKRSSGNPQTRLSSSDNTDGVAQYNDDTEEDEPDYNESLSEIKRLEFLLVSSTVSCRRGMLSKYMRIFNATQTARQHAGPNDYTGNTQKSSFTTEGSSHVNSNHSNSDRSKRKRGSEGDDRDENENERNKLRRHPAKPTSAQAPIRRLACPYHKHEPQVFGASTRFRTCAGPGWKDIAKVKEHLYRNHHSLLQCQRCKAVFKSQSELDDHAESETACSPRPRALTDGFVIEIYLMIKSKKKAFPGQDEGDKWREIYQLLFPNTEVPYPFFDGNPSQSTEIFNTSHPPSFEEFSSYALPHEYKRQATSLVDDTIRPLEMQIFEKVSTLLYDSQEAVSKQYQQIQNIESLNFNTTDLESDMLYSSLINGDLLSSQPDPKSPSNIRNPFSEERRLDVFPSCDFEISHRGHNVLLGDYPTHEFESTEFDRASNPSCFSCLGTCTCKVKHNSQPSDGSVHHIDTTDESVVSLIHSMSRSIMALEKRLNAVESVRASDRILER